MRDDVFIVHFIPKTSCFLYLTDQALQSLQKGANSSKCCLHMRYGNNKCAYFSWSPQPLNNQDAHTIGISAAYAQKLGLKDNEEVLLSCFNLNASVSKMNVCLESSDDWDVMEMSLHSIQSSLLNQIRVVWPGQIFVVWISKYLHLSLRVDSLDPSSPVGMLETFTDLIVSPPDNDVQTDGIGNKHSLQATATNTTEEFYETSEINPNSRIEEGMQAPTAHTKSVQETHTSSLWDNVLTTVLSAFSSKHKQSVASTTSPESSHTLSSYVKSQLSVALYRVHPLKIQHSNIDKSCTADSILCQPFNVFVHKRNLQPEIVNLFSERDIVVCKVSNLSRCSDGNAEEPAGNVVVNDEESPTASKKISNSRELYARLHIVDDIYSGLSSKAKKWFSPLAMHSEHCCILVPDPVQRALNISTGARLQLSIELQETFQSGDSTSIEIVTAPNMTRNNEEVKSLFHEFLKQMAQKSNMLLNTQVGVNIQLLDTIGIEFFTRLSSSKMKYTVLDSISVHNCNIEVKNSSQNSSMKNVEAFEKEDVSSTLYFGQTVSHLISEGLAMLELGLSLHPSTLAPRFSSNILIVGNSGSGKSTLAQHLCHRVEGEPHFVHCVEVQCSHLKGKTVEALQKLLGQWVADCICHQPAVLFLDDVDSIVGISTQLEEHSAEAAYNFRVGEMLAESLQQVQRRNYVLVIATAPSISKLSPSIAAARGQHFFKTVLQIPDLSKQDRLELLKSLISQKTDDIAAHSLQLESHAGKAEGYVVQDIADMVDKAVFQAWKRSAHDVVLEDCDVQAAMLNTVPLSLRGVTLYKDATHSWADVGGLTDVKRVLVEVLQWPSQYMELFSRCPLRHQSGLLLYGAPGTGKTLLAGAVAHECGLNFISVKGPELLSKYIGASEEAVRSIFQKAQSAQPCVLFFDEFDSLAPRRGHDSTGVTDRVVNQLLTQLDGVESLVGVWVVAATSRPDLLDPALLRPGRLDRAVQCALPELSERLDILRALSRRMRLAPDVDLAVVADGTAGFTGADLQAVLYTAQLGAVEDACKIKTADVTTVEEVNDTLDEDTRTPGDEVTTPGGKVTSTPGDEVTTPGDEVTTPGDEVTTPGDEVTTPGDEVTNTLGEVTQQHLLAALHDTRPSLSPDERLRYRIIYEKFVGARSGKSREMEVVSQRLTLA